MELARKKRLALAHLAECRSVVVALSGGVDSALLLALSLESLGPERVLAVTGSSPSLAADDLRSAERTARFLGARHEIVGTAELERPGYRANAGDRCFHCRVELFEVLRRLAGERGLERVVYGAIADDSAADRPGMRAAVELGIEAPLRAAGLGKAEVRALAAEAGLEVADRPAGACLASRLPVGTLVTPERLARVERAERALAGLGFGKLRVRDHGELARVELDAEGLARALEPAVRSRVAEAIRGAGFRFVTVDLEGYRTGGGVSGPDPDTSPMRDGGQ